jgi:hypothetical protein
MCFYTLLGLRRLLASKPRLSGPGTSVEAEGYLWSQKADGGSEEPHDKFLCFFQRCGIPLWDGTWPTCGKT